MTVHDSWSSNESLNFIIALSSTIDYHAPFDLAREQALLVSCTNGRTAKATARARDPETLEGLACVKRRGKWKGRGEEKRLRLHATQAMMIKNIRVSP